MNILVLGAGTFGTAIANELSYNLQNNVILFSRCSSKVDEINLINTNKLYFPNKKLNKEISATRDKKKITDADIIFVALPSPAIIKELVSIKSFFKKNVTIVNLSKGLHSSGKIIVNLIKEKINIDDVISFKGPSFAVEVLDHNNTLFTLGFTKRKHLKLMSDITKNTRIHFDFTNDINGVELLSVLKNIYAIVIGIVDAKYNSANTRFMMLTKSFSEIRLILKNLGGSEDTLFLSCGFGDFCLTSLNDLSRNRTLGLFIGKGFFKNQYKSNVIIEGLNAVKILQKKLNQKQLKKLPILRKIFHFFDSDQNDFIMDFEEIL